MEGEGGREGGLIIITSKCNKHFFRKSSTIQSFTTILGKHRNYKENFVYLVKNFIQDKLKKNGFKSNILSLN
jgi:hypothetical protein